MPISTTKLLVKPVILRHLHLHRLAWAVGIYVAALSLATGEEYRGYRQYQPDVISIERKRTIDNFPDMNSCRKFLKRISTENMPLPNLYLFPSKDVAEICLFWLFERLGTPDKVREWSYNYPFKERIEPEYLHRFLPHGFKNRKDILLQTLIYVNTNNSIIFSVGAASFIFRYFIQTQKVFLVWSGYGRLEQLSIRNAME